MLVYLGLRGHAAVHEYVPLTGVPVEVAEKEHLVVLVAHLEKFLGVVYRRVKKLTRVGPPPIQICANEVAPVVSIDDSIGVEHGYYLENECFAEKLCLLVVSLQ